MTRSARFLVWLAALSLLGGSRTAARSPEGPFAACEEGFTGDHRSARCFYDVGKREEASWRDAVRVLETHLAVHPDNPWLHLYLAKALFFERFGEAEERYRIAIEVADRLGMEEAQVETRLALTQFLANAGRYKEGDAVLAPAIRIAEEKGDPLLLAKVRIRQAQQYRYHGRGLDNAHRLLQRVEATVFRDGERNLRQDWLGAMTAVCNRLGRHEEALQGLERSLALSLEAGDRTSEAATRFAIAVHHITADLPSPGARREVRKLLEEALAAAEAAGHSLVELRAHFVLGGVVGGREGRRHYETCLEKAAGLGRAGSILASQCLGALAVTFVEEEPEEAIRRIDQALAMVPDSKDLWATAYGSDDRLHVRWGTLPRAEAVADSLDVLAALETLRELQSSESGRAGLMTLLSQFYYTVSGRLLLGAAEAEPPIARSPDRESWTARDDLELAFNVTERMRARVLLEALEAARAAAPPPAAADLVGQLDAVLGRKVAINRRLLRPGLPREDRERTVAELAAVEAEESHLRQRIAERSPSFGALTTPGVAALSELEESLAEDEAVLSYQVGLDENFFPGRFAGGSWLLASTRAGTRVYRLPDRVTLEPRLGMVLGAADLDGELLGLARLHQDLLVQVLEELPDGVERLVILPDGRLHRFPFALLRAAEDAAPLVRRYQLSVAPSATLWLRWRGLDPPASEAAALALADPAVAVPQGRPDHDEQNAGERQWAFAQDARLEPLPHAREEARTVVRTLGADSLRLVGEEATERFLKENDLRRYGVLHFAAHAVINDEVPERSAILLAPGADDEDGWLQPREIVELDLDGRVVVLASCESAAGQVLRGEGPMSLARAFFQAGAPVVVASLWPLPDDETAKLFKEFYESLAGGASVAGALAAAQREMLDRGAPARAWAGLVALGNGDLVPFPGGLERPGPPAWVYLAAVLLALAVLLLVTRACARARGGGRRTPSSARKGDAEPSR